MALSQSKVGHAQQATGSLHRYIDTSAANTALTVSVAPGFPFRAVLITVKYSAAPTQAGTTVTLNSGAGADYDAVLNTGSANAQTSVVYLLSTMVFGNDDSIDILAPAGGAGITSSIAAYIEKL